MNLNFLDVGGIVAYVVLTGLFAYLVRRTRTFADFSVGSRNVPALMVFASIAATYIGPGFSIGFTADGYTRGYVLFLLAMTYPLQTMLVALFVAPRLAQMRDCHTIGDVMEKRYGRFVHVLTGVVSVGLCIGFTAVMGKAGGQLLQSVTGWGVGTEWGEIAHIAVITIATALLTFSGGVRAVIATDSMHFVWISIVVPIVMLLAFKKYPGSAQDLWAEGTSLTRSGFGGLSGLQMVGIALSFLLGETLIPPYANRALAAKSEGASRGGFLLAALYCVVWLAIVATMGVAAHGLLASDTLPGDAFLALGRALLPYGTYGLLIGAGVAIVMSSQESVLNSAAVAFTRDIVVPLRALTDRQALIVSRTATILIAIIATWAASAAPSIIDGLLLCYSIWAPSILVPLVTSLYIRNSRPLAGWLSMIAGGGTAITWQFTSEPFGTPAILVGLAASIVGYCLGHALGGSHSESANSIEEANQ